MAVIPESNREKYLGLLSRCIVGESLNSQDQEAMSGFFWSPFKRIYGVNPIHIYPVTQEFVDALAEDLGFSVGRSQVVEEDLWL